MSGKRYTTIAEANQMIAALADRLRRVMQMRAQIPAIMERLAARGFAPNGDDFSLTPDTHDSEVFSDLAGLRTLIDTIKADMTVIEETGCVIKDLDKGLLDWYALRDGKDVFLCWKLGEKEIGFWHEIDTGFSGRRPLSEF